MILRFLSIILVFFFGSRFARAEVANYSLPGKPEATIEALPLAVIPLPGGLTGPISKGQAGEILAFQVRPEPSAPKKPGDNGRPAERAQDLESGAAILDLINAKLSILPGTAPSAPDSLLRGQLNISANAHSVYVSDSEKGSVKRFQIKDRKLVTERTFQYEDHSRLLGILTASAATNLPLILIHPTKTQFLSPDRLLPVNPRYGPLAVGAYPPLSNSSGFISDPTGTFFNRGGFVLWQYDRGELVSWGKNISIYSGPLSYNGALTPTREGMSATTARNQPNSPVLFIPALTRPLCYRQESVAHQKYGPKITICRNQGATPVLEITLPKRTYLFHHISFRANRLVAFSQKPAEILIYKLDLEKTLNSLGGTPWVEVTGPGYLRAGSKATFQMRPAFGEFRSLKLLSPLEQAEIKGTQIIYRSRPDTPTSPERIILEFIEKQGRTGTTFLDFNILGAKK